MKNYPLFLFYVLILSFVMIASCSKDDGSSSLTETAATTIGMKATFESGRALADVTVSTFLINVEDFELEFDDDGLEGDDDGLGDDDDSLADDDGMGSGSGSYTDIELDGPFELDLSQPGVVFPIANVEVPVGQYEELEFDVVRSQNPNSDLFQKSILIAGTLDNVPFTFWHDFEEDVEVEYEDTNIDIIVESDGESIIINFDLSFLFDTAVIDLSTAVDGNGDGIIEISPTDVDGNNALAEQIKEAIKNAIDLLDD
ncbi:MAG: hypothetical protein WD554_04180 [Flavobacteriaceae bacterium]